MPGLSLVVEFRGISFHDVHGIMIGSGGVGVLHDIVVYIVHEMKFIMH